MSRAAGRRACYVSLAKAPETSGDSDGYFEPLSPEYAWVSIEPLAPGSVDSTRLQGSIVTMDYHPQLSVETRLLYGTRQLFVKGIQNVDERNHTMVCYCEEAV